MNAAVNAAGRGAGRAVTVTYGTVLPVSPQRAFDLVSDPVRWPSFLLELESAVPGPDWGTVGGRAHTVMRLLGRSVSSELVLTEWVPGRSFRYTASQPGRPGVDNHRRFLPVAAGTRLDGSTRVVLRRGPHGLVDRLAVVALHRTFRRAMVRLGNLTG